jgi:hypothetical protein
MTKQWKGMIGSLSLLSFYYKSDKVYMDSMHQIHHHIQQVGQARFDIAMEGQSGEMYMMKVDIKNVAFESHPLFIAQNALGSKLESLCIQFAKRAKRDMSRYYQEKIDVRSNYCSARPTRE